MKKGIERCIHLMKVKHGMDISVYETSFLEKAIKIRMTALSIGNIDDYLLFLDKMPGESSDMIDQLSNSYSEFFRNTLTYSCLEKNILPTLIDKKIKSKENVMRIWSAACASGQEAYSIAILFDEIVQSAKLPITCRIFSTDINAEELDKAQRGIYPTRAVDNVSLKRIRNYFTQQDENFMVERSLGKYIDFSVFDLLSEQYNCPPASVYGNFDLVFCSNLLFYYRKEYRQRIIGKAGNCLAAGGYLITGEAEREMMKQNNYREVFHNSGIFQKKINQI